MKKLFASLALSFSLCSVALGLTESQKLADFHQLLGLIEAQYGPKLYKQNQLGLDLQALAQKYEDKVKLSQPNGAFY